jgi:hypothetical protein
MTKYLVTWEEIIIHGVQVEADSPEMAKTIFEDGEYDWGSVGMLDSAGVVENSIEVEEV